MNHLEFIREIYPLRTVEEISNIIGIVEEISPTESEDIKMEQICNFLEGNFEPNNAVINPNPNPNNIIVIDDDDDGDAEIGAVGGIHPDVVTVASIWKQFKDVLPAADPSYLREQAEKLIHEPPESIAEFLENAFENKDYPTMEDYLKRAEELKVIRMYTEDFKIEKFLEEIPNPEEYFENQENPLANDENVLANDLEYALTFLYNKYPFIRKKHINLVFRMKKQHLIRCCEHLDNLPKSFVGRRPLEVPKKGTKNVPLLKLIAYLKHIKLIKRILKYKKDVYAEFKKEAAELGLLVDCGICGESELIPEECFNCKKGCLFCKECIQRYVEVRMGESYTNFPCCNECDSEFDIRMLQLVLPRNTFERLILKIQSAEIKRANLDGLESCSFCDFATIPPEESKIFKCANPECLKETCRLCRHESHIPKRCNEVEYDEDVRRRTHIENMMTEALARTCYKCQRKFIKESGCNKMTCVCGSIMCFLCSQPINGYDHFKPNGCQLHTNDRQMNYDRVRANAQLAKNQLGNVEVKFDPTVGLEKFF